MYAKYNTGTAKYGSLTIGLHWLTLLLLIAIYATMELRGIFPKGSDGRNGMMMWHYMLGLSVLAVVTLRLAARWFSATPPIQPPPPRWQMVFASVMHVALYALMIGMPILGWLTLSAAGKPIPFFGLELPALISQNKELASQIKEVHETCATIGYFLIGLHAVAGLFHHYVVRDTTLRRMLPSK
ncbi:prokaryotic cytochrome b561 family protein [Collimonas arenae]|uniref:Prokaryotic cytochrome b561 family protein n=1 Tax=Collimonas arenae TaxID=279058 RepID=A0A127PQQ2_9BURK|nr:cytochrome b [Collimonas arenae]AMP00096.1 prokaryotic cytochrome b561 family protein [Collimonas arenae]AMP09991.1 prokaryotic cytochrome b561 family protein [Collimonas arenae]